MDLDEYDKIVERVRKGQIVAIAPAEDQEGNWHLITVAGVPSPIEMRRMLQSPPRERALFALRAIQQARSFYNIA